MSLEKRKVTQKMAMELYPLYSKAWWERSRWSGTGPKFQKIGRRVYYDVTELERFFNSVPFVQSTSEQQEHCYGG